ncbi:ribosome-recycling factor, chloroplastic-like isoform X2 [Durio zibethinus]|uniref:Ribosome-recycling factor, chloroplastic n=1 Tax=Durio zibethinus TaxID=66656 RepID=A0A6P5ZZS0_DURZI|nr:ribosome-recycling factor, chloroplastic-like isoform X2 [Durio zibethinus]
MLQRVSKIEFLWVFLSFSFLGFLKYVYCFGTWRVGIVRCATIEEIEAEKSSIEKDAVSFFINSSKAREFFFNRKGILFCFYQKARMEKTIEAVRTNFNSIRTGRANPVMLDKVEVEYYGTPVSLKSIAQIITPDSSSLLIQSYDKSSLKAMEKAVVNSDLGMTPNNDGEVIRLSLPQLTTERRKELSKVVAKQAEQGKVAVRNVRRDALKAYEKLEKEKKLSEDNVKDLSSDLQNQGKKCFCHYKVEHSMQLHVRHETISTQWLGSSAEVIHNVWETYR